MAGVECLFRMHEAPGLILRVKMWQLLVVISALGSISRRTKRSRSSSATCQVSPLQKQKEGLVRCRALLPLERIWAQLKTTCNSKSRGSSARSVPTGYMVHRDTCRQNIYAHTNFLKNTKGKTLLKYLWSYVLLKKILSCETKEKMNI